MFANFLQEIKTENRAPEGTRQNSSCNVLIACLMRAAYGKVAQMALDFENGNETLCFLKRLLCATGTYQATIISDGRARNIPFDIHEELAAEILRHDRRGQNIYHACAVYTNGSSRKASNVKSMKAFWLDIDCGAEKAKTGVGYATQEEALLALRAFCRAVGLPKPMIVDSGGGLHVYWPLKTAISPSRWKSTADKLKRATKAVGFLADQSRTTDAASILRPVGTHNRKFDPPRRVELVSDAGDIDVDVFEVALDSFLGKLTPTARTRHIASVEDTPRQRARLASMLGCISADCGYERYRDVVWAILSLGWEDADDLAEAWCLTAAERFDEANFTALLDSYDPERSPSIGTLIHLAREGAWHG
jgi:hypothetical protein